MSGVHEQSRKRRPFKAFLITTDLQVQDDLEGLIVLKRGFICSEQDQGKIRRDALWVKVLDNGLMVKIEKKYLLEVALDLVGLVEPVQDPEVRLNLLNNPNNLRQLASLPIHAPLWVQIGPQNELAEAELKYIGPLSGGSSALYFGVELKGSAAGRGTCNGSYKGHRYFSCPDACGLFVPVSHVRLRSWSSKNNGDAQEKTRENPRRSNHAVNGHRSNNERSAHHHLRRLSFHHHHPKNQAQAVLSRTTESAPVAVNNNLRGSTSPPPFHLGQRVSVSLEGIAHAGEVRFCGVLPGRVQSAMHVGILLDAPAGNWDGFYKEQRLCHIPSPLYGLLLPVNLVSTEQTPQHPHPLSQVPKSILKPTLSPISKQSTSTPSAPAPKIPLLPPNRQGLKAPPLPPPKPSVRHPLTAPVPPPKPQNLAPAATPQQLEHTNGVHGPASPLRSADDYDDEEEEEDDEEAEGYGETGEHMELEVGSMVEVNNPPLFGVIRWIGHISGVQELVAGIELEQELSAGTDGSYLGERHFRCPNNKGLFIKLRNCRRDSRFPVPEKPVNQVERCNSIAFADWGSERVDEHTPPVDGDEARRIYEGSKRGIQGHLNSCYLDATLFSLFSCCSSADWVLFWPSDAETDQGSKQAQELLRCEIVNPLRRNGYVCASKTMALRRLLEAASSDASFTNQEKDPEEFLNKLFQLLRVEPLLKIRSMSQQAQECHLYQLFPPTLPSSPASSPVPIISPASMRVASVQALLESSFLHAGLKFVEAPSCLLLLMPRFGKDFKMFDAILPTLSLDITDLLDDTLRQCSICQAVAEWECSQCYGDLEITPGRLKQYCQTCKTQVHSHRNRASHKPEKINVPQGSWSGPLHYARQRMSLFAVTCIETSHYVSFVKHGPQASDWLFFDSMADRDGGENGFNIPRVKACPEVGRYLGLSEEELSRVDASSVKESVRRLLCDSYMCLYHSPELSLYK
ncbi:LOW QUALITY PROTEIN: ubiquitin carboxyl-terminal hydrolase CYLD [Cyprinodon tularosa]|uniref:LOW QUALITY PROTEIN: ubiquitin carboxyl-terminal hydrolase CYLD n=1 Tax=Cyprinodon tularosa TaxID=77115 RepID=UPI0018E23251|nr:LOW QUALITY PROTEIN: ubiquitin carboxyl-terminal hydrolase CYLD [Cyprinodon tularosa]